MSHSYIYLIFGLFAILTLPTGTVGAQGAAEPLVSFKRTPTFGLPIDCTPNQDCWIMNYVDIGPDDGKQTDPACLSRTYDGHKGTDFAITDEVAMKRGVNVLAARDGTIKRTRDAEPDKWATKQELKQIEADRKECGNAILIDHGSGLQSIYCHLKQGSIVVEADQEVKRGDVVGQVGLSGLTEFPHLHFGILWEGAIVDPFTGQNNTGQCRIRKRVLWDKNLGNNDSEDENLVLEYQPLVIQNIGFSNIVPNFKKIERDASTPKTIPLASDVFTFWVTLLGVQKDDKIKLEIKDPNGKIFTNQEITQEKTRARQFYFSGRRLTQIKLSEGVYTGTIKVSRTDKNGKTTTWDKTKAILVTP